MSTKFNKKQIYEAKHELKDSSRRFWKKKRITKQVRIGIKNHQKLKERAKEDKVTVSKLLDKLVGRITN